MAAQKKLTPMMEQWHAFRAKLPADTLLLFRLGDFYEIFEQDADVGARLLGITLTQRHGMPMAGIPYHAADAYIGKLLKAGRKVAIVDQVETPRAGKLVKRALTRIITPGTTLDQRQLEAGRNHYLLAVSADKKQLSAAWLDLSTGDFALAAVPHTEAAQLLAAFHALDPRELILPESEESVWAKAPALAAFVEGFDALARERPRTPLPDYQFDPEAGARTVFETLGVLSLDGFGIAAGHPGLGAAGALLTYATETLCARPGNITRIREYRTGRTLLLDPATQQNLEVFKTVGGHRGGSLIEAMDGTRTAAGGRLLETWLAAPVLDLEEIARRQDTVGALVDEPATLGDLEAALEQIRDLVRILGRLQNRLRNPRELGAIRDTLEALPGLKERLSAPGDERLLAVRDRIETFDTLCAELRRALNEELPGDLKEGGTIRAGFDAELDRLYGLTKDNKTWLAELEAGEQARTGIKNLKVKYNGAFGYFIEVTRANLKLVPEEYIRKQTMTNAERYTTEALKQKEKEILNAEERAIAREEVLFKRLVEELLENAEPLKQTAQALAELDVFCGWARKAREWDYCKPTVQEGDTLEIGEGRHPVVEQRMREERLGLAGTHSFVPNDCHLSSGGEQIALITGPNMAGKSTFIRQVALIVLMAQTGAWVPAKSCHVGLVDRIFSRVGASDELARGNSTFMVEMNETANILNNASPRSLIILDEIGRGTSTYDGLSIAWAVVEHLHNRVGQTDPETPAEAGPRTLFATHYHELTQLARSLERLRNYSVAVKEWNDEIVFVRQVIPGAADRSYGIQVARLAGLPAPVIDRAKVLLEKLESDDSSHNLLRKRMKRKREKNDPDREEPDDQLSLF
ncbi:MAG: DNA mismatch repair protein MutS [Opitutales bacterium]